MSFKEVAATALIGSLAAAGLSGCGDSEPTDRGAAAVTLCKGHGGVIAFDDEIVICGDQISPGEPSDRGDAAVAICRGHGGVTAFEDEIAICRDQTSYEID